MTQFVFLKIYIFILLITIINAQESNEDPPENKSKIPGAGLSIVFIFGGLLYGGLLKSVCNRFSIPFNPLLLVSGIVLGNYHESLGFIGEASKLVSELNPNGFLAIFLPPLLFESAYKLEWHMFKKQFEQTLILGIPCVLLASLFIMTGLKLILGYDDSSYTWLQAFLVGCILCCTDIFSFVSKLKQIGTPQKLITLIEGQSLFNYFTCFLIFQIINEIIINYENYSILSLGQLVIQQILGGFLFGLSFGAMALFFLKRINYDGVLVVTLMIIFCYSIYMVAEFTVLRISGIISIVTYGIFMGIFGKPHLMGETASCMDSFWSYAVFIAETNIFLIAGVLVGVNVLFLQEIMNLKQFANIFFVYLTVLISRFISILLFKKQLSQLGYGMKLKEAFTISLSGLKGAIGISFAMIVFQNNDYGYKMRNLFLFHVTGNSLLNLFINSLFTVFIVKYLGLSTITKVENKFFKEFLQRFIKNTELKIEEMKEEKYLSNVSWNQINEALGFQKYESIIKETDVEINKKLVNYGGKFQERGLYKLQQALQDFANKNNPTNDLAQRQFEEENMKFHITVEVRKRFINALRHKYFRYHENHTTSPPAAVLLIQSANFDLDTDTEELESWVWIKNQFSSTIKFLSEIRKMTIIGSVARNYLFNYVSYCYDVVSAYIQANEEVRIEFRQIMDESFNDDIVIMILNESEQNQKQAQDFLTNYLQPSFPEIQKEVKTRKASFNILLSFKQIIDRYEETGQLEVGQFFMLTQLINKKRLSLDLHNPQWTALEFKNLLKNDEIFGILPQKILSVLDQNLSNFQTFDANQIIQTHSSIAKYFYFIRRGGCSIQYTNGNSIYKESLRVGNIFGFQSLISSSYKSTVTTNTLVVVGGIKKVSIEKIMDYFPLFEESFWKKYLFVFYKMLSSNKDISFHLSHLQKQQFDEITSNFYFQRLDEGIHKVSENMIFLRGKAEILTNSLEKDDSKLQPLSVILAEDHCQIKVSEKSSVFLGELSIELIQQAKYIHSIHLCSMKKKSSRPSIDGPASKKQILKQV